MNGLKITVGMTQDSPFLLQTIFFPDVIYSPSVNKRMHKLLYFPCGDGFEMANKTSSKPRFWTRSLVFKAQCSLPLPKTAYRYEIEPISGGHHMSIPPCQIHSYQLWYNQESGGYIHLLLFLKPIHFPKALSSAIPEQALSSSLFRRCSWQLLYFLGCLEAFFTVIESQSS